LLPRRISRWCRELCQRLNPFSPALESCRLTGLKTCGNV
jgi:hypothetical protein